MLQFKGGKLKCEPKSRQTGGQVEKNKKRALILTQAEHQKHKKKRKKTKWSLQD